MLSVIILSVVKLSVIMLSVVKLSVIMLSVIMLSVSMLNEVMLSAISPLRAKSFKGLHSGRLHPLIQILG